MRSKLCCFAGIIFFLVGSTLALDNSFLSRSQMGIKLGYNYATMNYSNPVHDNYATKPFAQSL